MGAFKFLTAEEQKDLPKLGFSDFDKTKATLDNLIGNLKWDMYKAQNPGWKSGATEDKAKCLASAKKNAEIIQYAVDTYLSNIDSGIKKDIYKYLNSVYSLNDKSDLSPYFEAKKNASPKGALSDFIAAFDSLDKTAFGTNKPSGESIDKSKELFYPSKTKLYSELAGISGVEDFLVQKGASENMAKEIAMLVAYDVKYGGGKTKELKLGMESEATTAVRNYIKAAYDSLSTDEAKAQFLQDLAEFYYNGVGRARKQIAQFAADKESVKGNKFIDALFAKNENMSAEMKSLSIGLDQFSAGLFNGYGIKSVKFDYKASDFKVEDLNHPLEGEAKFSIALADGKIMDGTIANHIIGAYLAAVSGKDADKTGEALKGIVAYFESQKTIAKVVAPTDLQEQKDLLEPKDLKKEPVKDISKQNAIDRALDLADTKKGQEQQPVSKPGELESTVNQIINSNEKTDWKSIYDALLAAKPEQIKAQIDVLVQALNANTAKSTIPTTYDSPEDKVLLQLVSFYLMNGGQKADLGYVSSTGLDYFNKKSALQSNLQPQPDFTSSMPALQQMSFSSNNQGLPLILSTKDVVEYSSEVLAHMLGNSYDNVSASKGSFLAYNNFLKGAFQQSSEFSIESKNLASPDVFAAALNRALPLISASVLYDQAGGKVTVTTRNATPMSKAAENILKGDEELQQQNDKVIQTEPKGYIQNNAAPLGNQTKGKTDEKTPKRDINKEIEDLLGN